jgi:PAS domain-containing protein
LKRQRETAETVVEANSLLLLNRYGFSEEAYFSWKFVPIIGDGGWVVGSYATAIEVTREVISDRRLHTVHNLGRQIYRAESIKDLWARVLRGIEDAEKDIPLALVYSLADTTTGSRIPTNIPPVSQSPQSIALSEAPPSAISTICILEGYIGIPKGHPSAPETVIFESDDKSYLKSALRQALQELMPVLVPLAQEAKNELSGINCRGHGVPPTQLVVCPIIPTDSLRALGFLVVALNPLRPYDDDYRGFLRLLIQQVTQPQLSAVIVKEKEEQRQQLAKKESLNRARLSSELSESETKFARFSSCAPIGLAILTTDFNILSANSLWCDLTGLRVGSSSIEWPSMLADGEVELVTEAWKQLTAGHKPITLQTRLRRPWRAPDLDHEGKEQWCENHILLAMYPDMDENGDILSVMGCITDINGLKWSESRLRRKMDQVIEMEKKQERFIDMIS